MLYANICNDLNFVVRSFMSVLPLSPQARTKFSLQLFHKMTETEILEELRNLRISRKLIFCSFPDAKKKKKKKTVKKKRLRLCCQV